MIDSPPRIVLESWASYRKAKADKKHEFWAAFAERFIIAFASMLLGVAIGIALGVNYSLIPTW
jgi:ABC-type proline/glycine betaine transport system permease subunit